MARSERSDRWYYHPRGRWKGLYTWRRGRIRGPFPWEHIADLIVAGELPCDVLVACEGDQYWRPADGSECQRMPADMPPVPGSGQPPPVPALAVPTDRSSGTDDPVAPLQNVGEWISLAWEMVRGDIWTWVLAQLLAFGVSLLTLGIAAPPMTIGLYLLALRRADGHAIKAGDVLDGLHFFGPAWGVALITLAIGAVATLPIVAMAILSMMFGAALGLPEPLAMLPFFGVGLLYHLVWFILQALFFFINPMVADGHGAWEAIERSVAKVRPRLWEFVIIWLIFYAIAAAGSYLCYVGLLVTWPIFVCGQVVVYSTYGRADSPGG